MHKLVLFVATISLALFPHNCAGNSMNELVKGKEFEWNGEKHLELGIEGFSDFKLKSVKCWNLTIGTLSMTHDENVNFETRDKERTMHLRLADVNFHCKVTIDVDASPLVVLTDTPISVDLGINSLLMDFNFESQNFSSYPPHQVTQAASPCTTDIDISLWAIGNPNRLTKKVVQNLVDLLDLKNKFFCGGEKIVEMVLREANSALYDTIMDFQSKKIMEYDPLVTEKALRGLQPNNWVNYNTSWFFDNVFMFANGNFGTVREENIETGGLNSTISDQVRKLTNGTGILDVRNAEAKILDITYPMTLSFILHNITVYGLDTIIEMNPFTELGNYTLETQIMFNNVTVDADFELDFVGFGDNGFSLENEMFSVSLGLSELNLVLALLLAIESVDENLEYPFVKFGELVQNPLECLFSTFLEYDFSRTWGAFSGFNRKPSFSGVINDDITNFMSETFDLALDIYGPGLIVGFPGIMLEYGPTLITDGATAFVNNNNKCPELAPYPEEPEFNFQSPSYWQDLVEALNNDVIPRLNSDFIPDLFNDTGVPGTVILAKDKVMTDLEIYPVGTFFFSAKEVKVSGLNSIHDVMFMNAYTPHTLRNEISLGGDIENFRNYNRRVLFGNNSNVTIEVDPIETLEPVEFSLILEINFDGESNKFNNEFDFSIRFQDFKTILDVFLLVNRMDFNNLYMEQLLSLDCIISTFDDAAINEFDAFFDKIDVDMNCISCDSPGMREMSEKVKQRGADDDFVETINSWILSVLTRFKNKMASGQLAKTIADSKERCHSNNYQAAQYPPYKAPSTSQLNAFAVIGGMAIAMLMGLIVTCCLRARRPRILKRIGRRRKNNNDAPKARSDSLESSGSAVASWSTRFYRFHSDPADIVIEGDDFSDDDQEHDDGGVDDIQEQEFETIEDVLDESVDDKIVKRVMDESPLFLHPVVPAHIRYGVLFVLIMNIFLFIVGHMIVAAKVNLTFFMAGESISMHGFAAFSIGKSIKDMWLAGVYPLCFLIATLSGAWPYTKVLLMLYLWTVHPKRVNVEKRGKYLMTLDLLGKWSMIDVYVLLLCMVAFGLHIENPGLEILPEGFYGVLVVVDPAIGLISFTAAAMLSLLANNVCLNYHRNAVAANEQIRDKIEGNGPSFDMESETISEEEAARREVAASTGSGDGTSNGGGRRRRFSTWFDAGTDDVRQSRRDLSEKKESLKRHVFTLHNGDEVRFTRFGHWTMNILLGLMFLLAFIGAAIPCFGFKVLGVVGMMMDFDEVNSWMPYSIFELFMFAINQAINSPIGDAGYMIGVFYLAFSFLLTAFLMPLVQILGLAFLWNKSLTLHRQKWFFFLAEVFSAWAAIDVWIVALLIAVIEMGQLSGFLLGAVCHYVLPLINGVLVPTGFVQEENATCLYTAASLEEGCAILLTVAFVTNVLNQVILRSAHKALDEREDAIKNHLPENSHHSTKPPNGFMRFMLWLSFKMKWIQFVNEEDNANLDITKIVAHTTTGLYMDKI